MLNRRILSAAAASGLSLLLCACSRSVPAPESVAANDFAEPAAAGIEWPVGLPLDSARPGDLTDASAMVLPQRSVLSITAGTNFTRGADFDGSGGTVAVLGQGASLQSTAAALSYALYRIPLALEQPGVVAADVNLHATSGGAVSSYWLGLSNYASGRWEWHGPFSDSHVRLSCADAVGAGADFSSPLGNLFVAVLAYDGAEFDVVGVGIENNDPADNTAPPVPAALGASGLPGAILLEWTASAASDLAGYRVYYSNSSFAAPGAPGVKQLDYLEAGLSHLLVFPSGGTHFCAVSAVDFSGNESALSSVESGSASAAASLPLIVETDVLAGKLNTAALLSVSGASTYDFDLNGDGVFELTGSPTATQPVDTSLTGIIRPSVRGHGAGGAVALGSVSLIISAGFPPVALLNSDLDEGVLWEFDPQIEFDASASTDPDTPPASLQYSFDPEGDGTFNAYSTNPLRSKTYTTSGAKLAAVKVKDPDGYEDVAYKSISIYQFGGYKQKLLDLHSGSGYYSSLTVVNGKPAIAYSAPSTGELLYVRATDAKGEHWGTPVVLDGSSATFTCLAVVKGNPAIVYYTTGTGDLKYIRCGNANGDKLADWSNPSIVLTPAISVDEKPILIDCNGNPAILYKLGGVLLYRRATTAAGTGNTLGDWADGPITVVTAGAQPRPSLALISGNPAVAYIDGANSAQYKRATTATGASALDWPVAPVKVSGTDNVVSVVCLILGGDGAPAIAWRDGAIDGVKFTQANTFTGDQVADWPTAVTAVSGPGTGSNYMSMALIRTVPAIVFSDSTNGNTKRIVHAADRSGSTWLAPQLMAGDPGSGVNFWSPLAEVDGLPAIAFHAMVGDCLGYALPDLSL